MKIYNSFQEEKTNREIIQYLDFYLSHLQAGMLPQQSFYSILQQKRWSPKIQFALSRIADFHSHGNTFSSSIERTIPYLNIENSSQYIRITFTALKIGCHIGNEIIPILEKTKEKIMSSLELKRKMKTSTAQMKMQSNVILLSPFFLGFFIWLISPEYIYFFFKEFIGRILLISMIIMIYSCHLCLKSILKLAI